MTFMRFIHKWIGLFLGLQLVIWMLSGFIMGWLDHDEVEGHHLSKHSPHQMVELTPVGDILSHLAQIPLGEAIHEISTGFFRHQAVITIRTNVKTRMFSMQSGEYIPVTNELAHDIAKDDFSGIGKIINVSPITAPTMETRESSGPGWRVDFDNSENSSLYISAETGQIWERRNETWRTFDIFWMLHIMDYSERKDFNNWIVILSSWVVLWLTISGFIMLFENIKNGDFNIVANWRARSKQANFTVSDADGGSTKDYSTIGHQTLFNALAGVDIHMPTSCGGGGSCGLCRVKMTPSPEPTASDLRELPQVELDQGYRLSCQHRDFDQRAIQLPHGLLDAVDVEMEVISADFVTPTIREIRLRPVNGKKIEFSPGCYFQITIPPYMVTLDELNLPMPLKEAWIGAGAKKHVGTETEIHRTYSAANAPFEIGGDVLLNVRLVLPSHAMKSNMVGVGSAFITTLNVGDKVQVRGPFGDFELKDVPREKIFIGGGAGMAPLRSMIQHVLNEGKDKSPISFWYGARTVDDTYYNETFEALEQKHPNFQWKVALSNQDDESVWNGATGFIHEVLRENYLKNHPNISECDFYLCGPPPMLKATIEMLHEYGISDDQIAFDDFGI